MIGLPNTTYVPTKATAAGGANEAVTVFLGGSTNGVVDPVFDIALGGVGWPTATNWSIVSSKLRHATGSTTVISDPLAEGAIGDAFYTLYTLSAVTAGNCTLRVGTISGTVRTANGTYAEIITSANLHTVVLVPSNLFVGDVDDVYVYPLSTDTGAPNTRNVIERIDWSYSAAPTGGGLQIADSTGVIYDTDITKAGPGHIDFMDEDGAGGGFYGTARKPLVIILKPGGGSVTGALNVTSR